MTEYIFEDVTNSDGNAGQSWLVTVDDNGKIVSQIPPNLTIPDDARMFLKNGGDKTSMNMNYGQFRSQPQNMEMTSADGTPLEPYEGGTDLNSMLDKTQQQVLEEIGVNGAQNASYGPNGIYDPAKPIKIDVAGTLTMALVSTLVLVGLMLARGNPISWGIAVGISAMATALEQVSPAGVDNLSVPLLVGLCWVLLIS